MLPLDWVPSPALPVASAFLCSGGIAVLNQPALPIACFASPLSAAGVRTSSSSPILLLGMGFEVSDSAGGGGGCGVWYDLPLPVAESAAGGGLVEETLPVTLLGSIFH